MPLVLAVLLSLAVAMATIVGASPVLRRLPLPAGHTGAEPPWHHLPRPAWLVGLGAASLACSAIGFGLTPPALAPLWVVWAGPVTLLVAIDAATTWLPLSLTRICQLALIVATGVSVALGLPLSRVPVMLAAMTVTYAGFWVIWRVARGGFGFGDVRLASLAAAVAAATSISTVTGALILASLLGVASGLVSRLRGSRGAFAYGPALWAGLPAIVGWQVISPYLFQALNR